MNEKSYRLQLAELSVAQLTPAARQCLWLEEAKKMAQALEKDTLGLNIGTVGDLWNLLEAWIRDNIAFLGARISFAPPLLVKTNPVDLTFVAGNDSSFRWHIDVWVDVYHVYIYLN